MRLLLTLLLIATGSQAAAGSNRTATLVAGSRRAAGISPDGKPLHWKDGKLVLKLARTVHRPGGTQGGVDPAETVDAVHAALTWAARAWTAGPHAAVSVEIQTTDTQAMLPPANIVTFTDATPFDEGYCDKQHAIACTLLTYYIDTGEIRSVGIAFNPGLRFSASGLSGTFDIAAVMLHEVGHAFGLDHSALLHSAMCPFVEILPSAGAPSFAFRELSSDDLLSLAEIYPAPASAGRLGRIEGAVRLDGQPLPGGHVIAVAADGTPAREAFPDKLGRYSMTLEPGAYTLLLEPLDGPIEDSGPAQPAGPATFPTIFWNFAGGSFLQPVPLRVEAGGTVSADFGALSGPVANLLRVGVVQSPLTWYAFQVAVPRGADYVLSVIREPEGGKPSVRLSAPSVALKGGTVDGPEPDLAEQAVTIPADAPLGCFNVYYHDGVSGAVLPGAVRVTPRPVIVQVRPAGGGEIAITGRDLAAAPATNAAGALRLGGVSVRVGSRFVLLVSASPAEIRARASLAELKAGAQVWVVAGPNSVSPPATLDYKRTSTP